MDIKSKVSGIQHVGIPTNDMQKSIHFYKDLGFEVIWQTVNEQNGESVSFLRLGNLTMEIYEGWHGPEHHPYVAYGHCIRKGEKFPARLTESEGDSILRKDLKEMCALFRHLGKDSLLVACLAYQVGPYKLLGYGRIPKSTLIRKLEAGNRDIYADFIRYCHYKGKKIPSIERRRKEEYRLLFIL